MTAGLPVGKAAVRQLAIPLLPPLVPSIAGKIFFIKKILLLNLLKGLAVSIILGWLLSARGLEVYFFKRCVLVIWRRAY